MKYSIEVISREKQLVSNWSGGITSQIAIWPPDADYSTKKFVWRLSTARVELEESAFTPLPGVERILMLMAGCMELKHTDHHDVVLQPYDQDHFWGDWHTKSVGRASDFNLMMTKGCSGSLRWYGLPSVGTLDIDLGTFAQDGSCQATVLYCADGEIRLAVEERVYLLTEGDALFIYGELPESLKRIGARNMSEVEGKLIRADLLWQGGCNE